MEETSNVPKLRFKEFTDEWEKLPAGKIFRSISNKHHSNEKLPILAVTQDQGVLDRDLLDLRINSNKKNLDSYKLVEPGDFIISLRSFQGGIEYSYIKGLCSPAYTVLKPKIPISDEFFKLYLKKENFISRLNSAVIGIRDGKQISFSVFSEIMIPYTSVHEQNKLSLFVSSIDMKLNCLEKKLQYLNYFKKYCLQNLFSDKSKLRFKEFNGSDFGDKNEFKTVKFESLIKKGKAGGTPKSSIERYYKGNIPFLSISDMTKQGKYITFTSKQITKEAIEDSSAWIIPKNSLLYSIYASIGFVSINRINLSTSQAIFGIILKDKVNINYIYYYLIYFKRFVHNFIETGTQGNLNKNILYNFNIKIPNSIEEQTKIATFLSVIDKKLDLTQKQIDLMEKFKKGLLQQMFV